MKKCRKCNFQSDAMLDYCWQCGTPLGENGQFHQGVRPTREYSMPDQIYYGYAQNYQPNYRTRKTSYSFGRIAAVMAGFFFVVAAIFSAGAAVLYKVVGRPPVPLYEPNYRYRNPGERNPAVSENRQNSNRMLSGRAIGPNAALKKIRADHDVRENGRRGMRIHVKFSVFNMKNVDAQLVVSFEKPDGTQLITTNKRYANKDGQIAVSRPLKPGWDDTLYKNLDVFMPYDELKLGPGRYALKMDADVTDRNGGLIEHLGDHDFEYEKK